jgi:putative peptidoglycan lipid II flippase
MWLGGAAVVTNIALALALRPAYGWIAVAGATAIAGWLNAGLLFGALVRRGDWVIDGDLLRRLPRLALAAGLMGGIVAVGGSVLTRLLAANAPTWQTTGALAGVVIAGISVFVGLVVWLGVVDWAALRSRRGSTTTAGACPSGRDDA